MMKQSVQLGCRLTAAERRTMERVGGKTDKTEGEQQKGTKKDEQKVEKK